MRHNSCIIVLDTETAGLSPQKNPLLEVGLVVLDWNLQEVERYQTVIAPYDKDNWPTPPYGEYNKQALEVNKLTMEDIRAGKSSKDVVRELIEIFKRCKKKSGKLPLFAGHNFIKFDAPYMEDFFKRHKEDLWKYVEKDFILDTMWISRLKTEESENFKLGTSCLNEKIELASESAHTALGDVLSNAELIKIYLRSLRGEGQGVVEKKKRFRDNFQF